MKTFTKLILILFLHSAPSFILLSQQVVHFYGFVKDSISGEVLPGATIYSINHKNGTVTDYNGYYNFKTSVPVTLKVAYVGYNAKTVQVQQASDTLLNLMLQTSNMIDEVKVSDVKYNTGNVSTLSRKELMQIPALGGKPDVVKTLQLLPGISGQAEGTSLLQVRGGDPGQNLYLFDNVPIVYVNHLGGFTSVFNPEMINNIDVYKGAFPAKYGGRLSSVVDITQRNGDKSKIKGNYSIGFPDISFCLEGPTKLENSSFIVAIRKTLTEPFLFLATNLSGGNDFSMIYGFHDINGKFTWRANAKNSFHVNLYYGDDYLNYWQKGSSEKFKYFNTWGNMMISGHHHSVLGPKLYVKNSISYSRYRLKGTYGFKLDTGTDKTDYQEKNLSAVSDVRFNNNVKHTPGKHIQHEYGISASLKSYLPFYSNLNKTGKYRSFSNEISLFASGKYMFLKHSDIHAGVRGISYNTASYSDYSLEPRLSLNIGLNKHHKLSAGYMRTKQYAHLLLTGGAIMLNEVWVPSGAQIAPSASEQYNFGYSARYHNYMFQADIYYKTMGGLAAYKEGFFAFEGDVNWLTKIENGGSGISKGFELFFKKSSGAVTGFLSYTLSRTTRQYPGINSGNGFLYDYDRPHAFSANVNYKINDRLNFNATWIYQTGIPYTPAKGKAFYTAIESGEAVYYERLVFGNRNSERVRAYHRLDIGLNYSKTTKNGRKAVWFFSVYNVYNRQNPYYYYYNTNKSDELIALQKGFETLPLKQYQITYFPLIPAVSYKVFFEKGDSKRKKRKIDWHKWLYMEE